MELFTCFNPFLSCDIETQVVRWLVAVYVVRLFLACPSSPCMRSCAPGTWYQVSNVCVFRLALSDRRKLDINTEPSPLTHMAARDCSTSPKPYLSTASVLYSYCAGRSATAFRWRVSKPRVYGPRFVCLRPRPGQIVHCLGPFLYDALVYPLKRVLLSFSPRS